VWGGVAVEYHETTATVLVVTTGTMVRIKTIELYKDQGFSRGTLGKKDLLLLSQHRKKSYLPMTRRSDRTVLQRF
jgi:hypothetical protein